MHGRTSLVAIVAALLAGCSTNWMPWVKEERPTGANWTPPGATGYACDGGKRLLVRLESDGKSVWVIYTDHQLRLDRVASGGDEYSRAGTTLSTKDGATTLIEGNAVQLSGCKPETKP